MELEEIISRFKQAIDKFLSEEVYLIENDISERAMTHRLAIYIDESFKESNIKLDVDCEYNGMAGDKKERKKIHIVRTELQRLNLIRPSDPENEELLERSVYPDIIVHQRGNHKFNLLIVEVKKLNSRIPIDYDLLKLKEYTSTRNPFKNRLCYQLGILGVIGDANIPINQLTFFKDGSQIDP